MKSAKQYKIGFVLDGGLQKPDGVQQYILTLGEYYTSIGHSVRYIVSGDIPKQYSGAVSLAKAIKVNSNGNILYIPLPTASKPIKQYLSEEKFDVLHIQVPYSPFMGAKVVRHADSSTVIIGTFHIVPNNFVLSIGDWLLGKISYPTLRKFNFMVSVSDAAAKYCRRDFGIKSLVIPNTIDLSRFKRSTKKHRELNILYFGRLVKRKNCLTLLRAINLLKDNPNLPKYRVVICGSGEEEKKLKKYVTKNKLNKKVSFKGFIKEKDKAGYFNRADIAVFPSSGGESFGIVLLEAMSSSHSVILAGSNDGYRSVLKYYPELLFKPNDADKLANLLEKYMVNGALRKQTAKKLGAYVKEFDVKVVGGKLLDIYQSAISKNSGKI